MKKKIKLIQINVIFVLLIQWLTFTENWVQMMRVRNLTYPHADSILIFWARGCALWYSHVSIFKFNISFPIMFQFSLMVQVNKENYRTLSSSRCCHAIFHLSFTFHLKDKFHGRSKIFSQRGSVMHHTHFLFYLGKTTSFIFYTWYFFVVL